MSRPRLSAERRRRLKTRFVPLVAAFVAAGLGLGLGLGLGSGGAGAPGAGALARRAGSGIAGDSGRTAGGGKARTFPGPYGVESAAILAENRKPGTTAWQITHQPATGFIEGFASTTSAQAGQRVRVYVSTDASSFHVVAYRMGWYQGKGARAVWRSGTVRGVVQPACRLTPGVNMVSCDDWHRSLEMPVTPAFLSGDYLLKLVGSGGQQAYALLTVWEPSSRATYLVIARPLTEEGWNTFGGYDFYQGEGACPPGSATYPPCNRARVVSLDRPYAAGDGAADFLGNELPLVELLERHGLDATYATDVTVSEHPSMLLHHRALLSLGHDETWTASELLGVEDAVRHGVNLAFFSAAAIVRHARLQPSALGPDREVVDYRDADEDPLDGKTNPMEVTGNTWASPPTSWSATSLTGELYSGYLLPGAAPVPLVVHDAGAFLFAGTGLADGSEIPGVIASDIDHVDPAYPMPQDLQVLAHSPVPLKVAYTNQGDWNGQTYSDMTYYTAPSGAGVFDSGTVNFIGALASCSPSACPEKPLSKITGNLLRLFGRGPAGRFVPSVANWRAVSPTGS